MNSKLGQTRTAILILVALIVAILAGIIVQIWIPGFRVIPYIGVVSTLSIAFLTVAYVLVTSSQLRVMTGQLSEMARTRELDAQPLPLLHVQKFHLERPRFFYTPPDDRYHANPRFLVSYKLVNQGIHPAVNIVAAGRLIMRVDDDEIRISGGAREIDVLASSEEFPHEDGHYLHFLFTGDKINSLIKVLRDRSYSNPPLVAIRLLYKNVLGACFAGTWFFEFSPKTEDDFAILGNWDTKMTSFDVEYKEELKRLPKLKGKDEQSWESEFKSVRGTLDAALEGGQDLELAWVQIPNSFRSEVISSDRYNAEVKQRFFGRPIPNWITSCIAKNEGD